MFDAGWFAYEILQLYTTPVSDRITRGRNAIFGHVARLTDNIPSHQVMLRQVELSVGRPQDHNGNVHQVNHVQMDRPTPPR